MIQHTQEPTLTKIQTAPAFEYQGKFSLGLPMGTYDRPAVDLSALSSPTFNPYLVGHTYKTPCAVLGCGVHALYTLTGVEPLEIVALCKMLGAEDHTKLAPELMAKALNAFGFVVCDITIRDLCPAPRYIEENITVDHVLLTANWVAKNETSWFVFWGNYEFHNTEIRPIGRRLFINNPLYRLFVVKHPNWDMIPPVTITADFTEHNPEVVTRLLSRRSVRENLNSSQQVNNPTQDK